MWMLIPRIFFICLFSKDKAKNINNFIVKNTVTTWKTMKRILQEPMRVPKNTTLWNIPWIAFQESLINWSTWKTKGIAIVNDMVTGNTFIPMAELKSNFGQTNVDSIRYMQHKSYISQN
jgi:hypothetical protein